MLQQGGFQLAAVGTQNALKKRLLLKLLEVVDFRQVDCVPQVDTYQFLRGVAAPAHVRLLLPLLDLTLSDLRCAGSAAVPEGTDEANL